VTPKGREVYEISRECALGLQTEVLSCLSEGETQVFLEMLDRVAASATGAAEDAKG
jgi:DNA-binding MarR family transcriptional regulator